MRDRSHYQMQTHTFQCTNSICFHCHSSSDEWSVLHFMKMVTFELAKKKAECRISAE